MEKSPIYVLFTKTEFKCLCIFTTIVHIYLNSQKIFYFKFCAQDVAERFLSELVQLKNSTDIFG